MDRHALGFGRVVNSRDSHSPFGRVRRAGGQRLAAPRHAANLRVIAIIFSCLNSFTLWTLTLI